MTLKHSLGLILRNLHLAESSTPNKVELYFYISSIEQYISKYVNRFELYLVWNKCISIYVYYFFTSILYNRNAVYNICHFHLLLDLCISWKSLQCSMQTFSRLCCQPHSLPYKGARFARWAAGASLRSTVITCPLSCVLWTSRSSLSVKITTTTESQTTWCAPALLWAGKDSCQVNPSSSVILKHSEEKRQYTYKIHF